MKPNENGQPPVPQLPVVTMTITYDLNTNQISLEGVPTHNWIMAHGLLKMAEKIMDQMRAKASAAAAGKHGIVIARPRLG